MPYSSYAAIGDSFTEGVGDELPDGRVRGWADIVALGLSAVAPEPLRYANLAIRGRLLAPIAGAQLDDAIALAPELLSINGGGNDIMRPRVRVPAIADELVAAARRAVDAGCHVLLVSGANPTRHLPLGASIGARGDQLAAAVRSHLPIDGVTFVDNWADDELAELRYWSRDKLHLNARGHERVAGNVLSALGVQPPQLTDLAEVDHSQGRAAYWREYVLPWIGRRLTGRSSGDSREPKYPTLLPLEPLQ